MLVLAVVRPFACRAVSECVGKGPTLHEAEDVDEKLVANESC